ncbi:MAG TPA: cytochrome c [Bryobacteraceae bacterium]|jgi:mono/diheme cytochrome c family protein
MAIVKRRTKRFFRRVLQAIPVILVVSFLYVLLRPPSRTSPLNIKVDMSPSRVARGEYIFTALSGCDACHSERDFSKADAPVAANGRGKGQVMPFRELPGEIVASNITTDPDTGLGTWTDGEKIRAIREGIGKDGRTLFPLMPYPSYRIMTDDDVQALVAYMDTLPPVKNSLPQTNVSFPASMLMRSLPRPTGIVPAQDTDGGEAYGEYLATVAACVDCHSPTSRFLEPDSRLLFAGGRLFSTPQGTVNSSNITPDKATGIGTWNFERFAAAMQHFKPGAPADPAHYTWMPWQGYAQLTGPDLEDLFLYVKSLKAVNQAVQVHP